MKTLKRLSKNSVFHFQNLVEIYCIKRSFGKAKLAEELGIPQSTLYRWLSGRYRPLELVVRHLEDELGWDDFSDYIEITMRFKKWGRPMELERPSSTKSYVDNVLANYSDKR
ncbi:MAG: helix-turn-helix transcriptional regulator [Candidatus Binatia bacterium]|nr:helix-turn-helix transcriptional regulator [Candidatus Binatia bacterium]